MRQQIDLIHKIMQQVYRHPHNGQPTYFTVHYEVFHVTNAILQQQAINPKVTLHMTHQQINELYTAGITHEDVETVKAISAKNIDLLYKTLGDLMEDNHVDVRKALNEMSRVIYAKLPPTYAGNYSQELLAAKISDTDFNYMELSYRIEPIRGMMLYANVPPRLAIKKLRECTEQGVNELWWAAESTHLELTVMMLEYMQMGISLESTVETILTFVNNGSAGNLTAKHQKSLTEKSSLFIIHQFSSEYILALKKKFKIQQLKPQLSILADTFKHRVNEYAVNDLLNKHDDFIECYQHNRCHKLFSHPNLQQIIIQLPSKNNFIPKNTTIEAAIPVFLKNNPDYLDSRYLVQHGLSTSFVLIASTYILENPMVCEVGLMALLSGFLLRHKIAKWSNFFFSKNKQEEVVTESTSAELAPLFSSSHP